MQDFTSLTSLKKLRLDSCGKLRCHPDVASAMLRQLGDISLRQCRLSNVGCLDVLLGLPSLRVSPLGCQPLHQASLTHRHTGAETTLQDFGSAKYDLINT